MTENGFENLFIRDIDPGAFQLIYNLFSAPNSNFYTLAVGTSSTNPTTLIGNNRTTDDIAILPRLPEEDMSLLAQCNHSIITVGTYGFWAGYLSAGITLYPDINTTIPYQNSRSSYDEAGLENFIPITV